MKKLTIFAAVAAAVLFIASNFVSADWRNCFDRQFIDDTFEVSFNNPIMGFYVENLGDFKERYMSQREEFLRLAGIFCGDVKILTPRQLWDNAGVIVKNELNRWRDFKILWASLYLDENGAIKTKISEQDAGADFEKKSPAEWRQEYFINLLIHQAAYMANRSLSLEELASELDAEIQEEIFKNVSFLRWKETFKTIVIEIKEMRMEIRNADLDGELSDKHLSDFSKIIKYPNR